MESGYTEAYHEIWRAEAALATYYKEKHESLCYRLGIDP
jgi:hypothetical protein